MQRAGLGLAFTPITPGPQLNRLSFACGISVQSPTIVFSQRQDNQEDAVKELFGVFFILQNALLQSVEIELENTLPWPHPHVS